MLIKKVDYITEFFLYLLMFGITFSNWLTEFSVGLIIFCFLVKIIARRRVHVLYGSLTVALALFFIWIFISFVRSPYPKESSGWLLRLLRYFFVYFALLDFFYTDVKKIRRFFWALIGIGTFTFLNGIFQGIAGFSILRHERTVNMLDSLRRISASFVHPNDFGAFIITVLPLTFAFFAPLNPPQKFPDFSSRDKHSIDFLLEEGASAFRPRGSTKSWKKIVLVVACLLGFYCLFKTSSRSAWVGFFIGIILFFTLYRKKIAFIIPVVLLALLLILPQGRQRVVSLFSAEQNTVWERKELWKGTLNMIKEHPIAGFGVNTFSRNFPQYKPPEYPDLRYTHNCYLQMWSEIGIIGLLSFLAIVACVFFLVGRRLKEKRASGFLGFILFALLAGYTAFLIQSAMDTNLYSLVLTFHFWVLSAYLIAINKTIEEKQNV